MPETPKNTAISLVLIIPAIEEKTEPENNKDDDFINSLI